MLWTLWDILIPLLVTFILGLGLGWMLWRWRRRHLQASELAQLESRATQQMNAGAAAQELQVANEQLSVLTADLQSERSSNQHLLAELDKARHEATAHADSAAEVVATGAVELEISMHELQSKHDQLQQQLGECSSVNQQHQQRIQSLEADLQNSRRDTDAAQRAEAESKREIQALQARNPEAAGVAGVAGQSVSAQKTEVSEARIGELERQLQEANAQLTESSSSIDSDLLQQREAELREREAELEAAQLELKASAEQRAELIELREKLAGQSDTVEEEARARQLQMSAQLESQHHTELTAAREQLQERDARIATLEGSIARLGNAAGSSRAGSTDAVWPSAGSVSAIAGGGSDEASDTADKPDTENLAGGTAGATDVSRFSSSSVPNDSRSLSDILAAGTAANQSQTGESSTVSDSTGLTDTESATSESSSIIETDSTSYDGQSAKRQSLGLPGPGGASEAPADCARVTDEEPSLPAGRVAASQKGSVATASGYVPSGWVVPEKVPARSERDELTTIKGVGPKLEGVLHNNGIYYFRQVALLNAAGIDELQEQMPEFRGRIQRDNWVSQAAELHQQKYGELPK